MTSATDELRLMLDERGVEYRTHGTTDRTWFEEVATLGVSYATPTRQGVAGTCKADETDTIKCWVKCKDEPSTEHMELIHVMECSACGGTYEYVNGGYEFCPRCGRRVVE